MVSNLRYRIVLGLLITSLLACGTLSYFHFESNPLPWPDHGNAVYVCPDKASRKALLTVLAQNDMTPDKKTPGGLADRAIFMRRFRFIVNVTEPGAWEKMGKPVAGLAIVTETPAISAGLAKRALAEAGYTAEIIYDPDDSVPQMAMTFLTTNACPGVVLIFRKHFTEMGPEPPAWTDEE
jgi:hypothetical protein